MPITYERSYKASDGNCYATLAEAQEVEIKLLLEEAEDFKLAPGTAEVIVANKDAIVNILTLNDSSRPKARGSKKPRKKIEPPAQAELPKVA
jgi:hypothetical protein